MKRVDQDRIHAYLQGFLLEKDPFLIQLREKSLEEHIPIIDDDVKSFLDVFLKTGNFTKMLEVGTATGYSSICFAKANTKLKIDTIEKDQDRYKQALGNIKEAGVRDRIHCFNADIYDVFESLPDQSYDVIFLDGAKGQYVKMLPHLTRLLVPGGILLSDNILFKGHVALDEEINRRKRTIIRRLRSYIEELTNDVYYETTLLPIGDGLAISRKKEVFQS
ncbi:MAG TPA: O-methyltransferase [Eubacteriaceae bacterium]|nr:O-methyltransferase [Eubacteriaceae bacterium]